MGEYYARENLKIALPFVPMGTTDEYYTTNWSQPGFDGNQSAFNILHGAYVLRKGMDAPYMELKRATQPQDMNAYMYLLPESNSKAKPLPPAKFPAVSPVGRGLVSKDIGSAKPAGSSSYGNGVWTVKGAGSEIWTHEADSFHFASMPVKGDCAIVAKIESIENTHPNAKAGIMLRSDLKDSPASKIWIALRPFQPAPNDKQSMVECYMHGWTNCYGGSNWEAQSYWVPRLPYWLKIERVGDVITAYASPDGTSWACLVYGEFKNMPENAYAGLAVCSFANGTLNTSKFSHVNVTGGTGGLVEIPEAPLALLGSPGLRTPLRWTESFGTTGYNVKRATTPGGPYTTIATGLAKPSYLDTTADFGPAWYYVVTATNAAGESPPSPEEKVAPHK